MTQFTHEPHEGSPATNHKELPFVRQGRFSGECVASLLDERSGTGALQLPNLAGTRPSFAQLGSNLVGIARISPNWGRKWPEWGRNPPNSADVGPIAPQSPANSAHIGQFGEASTKYGLDLNIRPDVGRVRPCRPHSAETTNVWLAVGQSLPANVDQSQPDVGQHWPGICLTWQIQPDVHQMWPKLDQYWLGKGQTLPDIISERRLSNVVYPVVELSVAQQTPFT